MTYRLFSSSPALCCFFILGDIFMSIQKISDDWGSVFDTFANNSGTESSGADKAIRSEFCSIHFRDEAEVIRILESLDWSFNDDDTTYLSHDIHPYPAKFAPQLPAQIIKLLSSAGEMVWDPFGGSGTTALEALLHDRSCISTDINPIGSIIGKAKTSALCSAEEQELDRLIMKLEYYTSNEKYLAEQINSDRNALAAEIPAIPNIAKWFNPSVICELAFLKYMIKKELQTDAAADIAKASLSKIITRVSNQENETTYRAVQKVISITDTTKLFLRDLKANYTKIKALSSQLGYRSCRFITANVMEPVVGEGKPLKAEEVDLIVTSPPYPNAFDYHLYHRFRIFWLDGDPREMGKAEIGSHLKYQRSRNTFSQFENEMRPVLNNCLKALKSGRYAVFILGNAVFDGKEYKTAERISALAESIGFKRIAMLDRPLPENKRSIKSWARRAVTEQILILKKPALPADISLIPVKYRLWPYEKTISSLERRILAGADADRFKIAPQKVNELKNLTFYQAYRLNGTEFDTWQSILENGKGGSNSGRKDPKYLTHGIHPYKGKFYPQLVRPLLNILNVPKGGTVFDPFCGSGTVLLESILNGYQAFGCDINPIAVEIASAKSSVCTVPPYAFEKHISLFRKELLRYQTGTYTNVFPASAIEEIQSWFPEKVICKMGFILTKIKEVPDERIKCFLRVILSSIIRDVSQQEPTDLRIRRRKQPIDDAPVLEMYMEALEKQYGNIMSFYKIRNYAPYRIGCASVWRGNATRADNVRLNLPAGGVDIVITSPPYATALPYIDTNRLNMLVLSGINASMRVPIEAEMTGTREINKSTRVYYEQKIEQQCFDGISSPLAKDIIRKIYEQNLDANVGFRRKNMAALIYMYFRDMSEVLHTMNSAVKSGGHICIVIGDTKTTTGKEKVVIRTTEVLRETAARLGWSLTWDLPISVTVERYLHMNHSITENNILMFKKP